MDEDQAKNHVVSDETQEEPKTPDQPITETDVAEAPSIDQEDISTPAPDDQSVDVPTEQPPAVTEPKADEPAPKKPKHHFSKKTKLIVALVVLLLAGGGAAAYMLLPNKDMPSKSTDTEVSQQSSDQKKSEKPETVQLQNVTFTGSQQKLGYLPIFSDAGLKEYYQVENLDEIKKDMTFYKVGTADDGDLVMAKLPTSGLGDYEFALVVSKAGQSSLLQMHSSFIDLGDGSYIGPKTGDKVSVDTQTIIAVLEAKETISYDGVTASKTPDSFAFFIDDADTKNMNEVAKIDQNVVYERVIESDAHPGVKQLSILLKQPTGLYLRYRYTTDILKDDNSTSITLTNGSTVTKKYDWAMVRGGCGVVDSVNVLDKAYFNDLVQIGKAGGEPVYGFKSANHQVVSTIYKAYNYDGKREGAVSKDKFWKDNGVVVVRNKLGYRVILVNADYQAQGECGKPVIYLYPEHKTDMSVQVGADVTISDPAYGSGWDVTAYPDGRIFNKKDGKTYPYLFWEGTGHGAYPEITEGFVVKRADVNRTLRAHLAKLGLNQQESADFLEFWLPLVPDSPYVRLTWFGTEQMNKLAPLKLSIKPDTMIRIFLDFQGLDKPINLKPQRLSHPERKGFVLVEWGGLLYVY